MPKIEVSQEIKDLVALVDRKYDEAKKAKVSRFSVEWGKWSREMNVELRKKGGILFKYVTIYWVLKSQMLELFFKYPSNLLKRGCKRRTLKEVNDIREIILTGDVPEEMITEEELQKRILNSK